VASITIRNLDDALKARLRLHAARHGRSMEEAAREILKSALAADVRPAPNLADALRRRVAKLGGIELDIPAREMLPPPRFGRQRR
jgi:plasmid stability protein